MRKLMKLLISALMVVTCIPIMSDSIITAKADTDYYPMQQGCSGFEVDTVKDDGNFEYRGCYSNFGEAKNAMAQLGDDGVVRAADANTHTRIVAMNRGIAYTCTLEGRTVSLNSVSSNVTGYMTDYRQVNYVSTDRYDGSGNGQVRINVGGFDSTADLKVIVLIPFKYVDNHIAVHLTDDLYVTPKEARYTVVQNGNYRDLVYSAYSIFKKDGTEGGAVINYAVGPAASWMTTGKTYYSCDDVHFYNDNRMTSVAGTYYNYYQFEPLRTKTSLTAQNLNSFLASLGYSNSVLTNKGQAFIDAQNQYGMNAALVFAQACLESAYGTSEYARLRNNLFGWNAVDSDPNQASYFKSMEACINQQMALNLRGYLFADDWRFFGAHFGNKSNGITFKYASDPYYGLKISHIMYEMDKFANNYNGNLSEYASDTVGVIHTYKAPVYLNAGSNAIYTTEYQAGYQDNNTVVILGEEGDYYKIQSDNILENGKCVDVIKDSSVRDYDWNYNVGYMKKSDIDILYNGSGNKPSNPSTPSEPEQPVQPSQPDETVDPDSLTMMNAVTDISYKENNTILHIEGKAFLKGMDATDLNQITHTIIIENLEDGSMQEVRATSSSVNEPLNMYDEHTYTAVKYSADIPMNLFGTGEYVLKVKVKNRGYYDESYMVSDYISELEQVKDSDGLLTRVYPDSRFRNRFEVSRTYDSLDYASIVKPTKKFSSRSMLNMKMENGKLFFNGYAFFYKADMNVGLHPNYSILLQDENGRLLSFDVENKVSSKDYNTIFNYGKDLSYADYSVSIDLSQIPVGTYRIYIDIKNDSYHDIDELFYYKNYDGLISETNGHTYNLYTSNIHKRFMLEVK